MESVHLAEIEIRHFWVEGDFSNGRAVMEKFIDLCKQIPHVTLLGSVAYDFTGGGISFVILIAESHIAVHTWPEYGKAWFEMATCGEKSSLDVFQNLMQEGFKQNG